MTSGGYADIVIVGAGQAGGEIATELHKQEFHGCVVLIGDEPQPPYRRPPLSKGYFAGSVSEEALYVMPPSVLGKEGIDFISGVAVAHIDREAKRLTLSDGRTLGYGKLALTTGGRARPLTLPGAHSPNVFLLRTIADVSRIRARAKAGARIVIVGGGFIGLETAAVAIKLGMKVTVLEGLPRVLARVTVPEISDFFAAIHRQAGVDLHTNAQITSFEGEPEVTHVQLANHERIPADLIVAGIGLLPNTELAQEAGLVVDNGIVVDEYARTSDPDIVAAGDCTNHPSAFLGRHVRLESVQNALEQARTAAATLVGKSLPYQVVPWFWSDQYDIKLQMVGASSGFDRFVLRGDTATRAFSAFYLREGRLIAADAVNRPQDFVLMKKWVASHAVLEPHHLADTALPLKTLQTA